MDGFRGSYIMKVSVGYEAFEETSEVFLNLYTCPYCEGNGRKHSGISRGK